METQLVTIKASKEQLQALQILGIEIVPETPPEQKASEIDWWKPNDGDTCWCINEEGSIYPFKWGNNVFDNGRLAVGNVFPTKEAAEQKRKYLKAEAKIAAAVRTINGDWVADWADKTQTKGCFYYDHTNNKLHCGNWTFYQNADLLFDYRKFQQLKALLSPQDVVDFFQLPQTELPLIEANW